MSTNPAFPPDPNGNNPYPAPSETNAYGQQAQPPYGQPYPQQPPYGQPYGQPQGYPPAQTGGLSQNTAAWLAYVTIIPAIVFLVVEPYKSNAFVRFNSIQCLLLAAVNVVAAILGRIPVLGLILYVVIGLAVFILWLIAIINAAQGKVFRIPLLGDFAAQQAGL